MLDAGHLPVVRGLQLSEDDRIRRELIGELMCHGRIDTRALGRRHRLDFADYFAEDLKLLSALREDGLVTIGPDAIEITPRGRLLIRHAAMCFDPYLRHPSEPVRYSRAI
jgi:oxygen-independent coproporphyrinogen-3 oxidase